MGWANLIRLGLLACIWGSSFLLIELALEGFSPVQIVLGRLASASLALTAVAFARGHRLPKGWSTWVHLALMGLAANVGAFFLMSWGQQTVTSSLSGVLNAATPLFTVGFAVATLPEERLSGFRAMGLLFGFAGVVVVLSPWEQDAFMSSIAGQLACLAAAAVYGGAFVYTRRFIAPLEFPLVSLAAGQLIAATVILGLGTPWIINAPAAVTPVVVLSVVALGVVGTALAYLFYYRLIVEMGATSASLASYLVPVVAVGLGVAILHEPLGWNLVFGAPLVIGSVALAEWSTQGASESGSAGHEGEEEPVLQPGPAFKPQPPLRTSPSRAGVAESTGERDE